MNIIEAVRSGKLFKRARWACWYDVDALRPPIYFSEDDLLADDYYLEDHPSKLITWYRPKLLWNTYSGLYEEYGPLEWNTEKKAQWSTEKKEQIYDKNLKVVEWEMRQLPEEWKEV